jgi:hypothetical protein
MARLKKFVDQLYCKILNIILCSSFKASVYFVKEQVYKPNFELCISAFCLEEFRKINVNLSLLLEQRWQVARQGCDVGFCHTIEISDYLHIKQIVSSLLQDFNADINCCKAANLWLKVGLDEFKAGRGADLFKNGFKFVNSEDGFELRWEVVARVTHFGDKVLESVHVAESRLRIS